MTMTPEEKAMLYDIALERAKLAIKECGDNKGRISMIESIFPELSESEDERVRKDIMVLVKDWWDRVNKDNISTKEEMIAWLEKKGELTQSVTKISEQEQKLNEYKDAEEASAKYRKFREDCGIKDPVMLDEIEEAYYNGATSIQKHAWSDEDEENLQHCCCAIAAANYYTVEDKQDMVDWLKSLKK